MEKVFLEEIKKTLKILDVDALKENGFHWNDANDKWSKWLGTERIKHLGRYNECYIGVTVKGKTTISFSSHFGMTGFTFDELFVGVKDDDLKIQEIFIDFMRDLKDKKLIDFNEHSLD